MPLNAKYTIMLKDTKSDCRRWIMGYAYAQNAYSFNSTTISMPVNSDREMEITLEPQAPGYGTIEVYLVAFK